MWGIFTSLFPPEDSSPEQASQWRRSISSVVIANGALTVAVTWILFGIWPVSYIFTGFATVMSVEATADDIAKVRDQLTRQSQQITEQSAHQEQANNDIKSAILLSQLNQIFDAMCGAIRGHRREEADLWEKQFTDKIIEYSNLTGMTYPMRNCT